MFKKLWPNKRRTPPRPPDVNPDLNQSLNTSDSEVFQYDPIPCKPEEFLTEIETFNQESLNHRPPPPTPIDIKQQRYNRQQKEQELSKSRPEGPSSCPDNQTIPQAPDNLLSKSAPPAKQNFISAHTQYLQNAQTLRHRTKELRTFYSSELTQVHKKYLSRVEKTIEQTIDILTQADPIDELAEKKHAILRKNSSDYRLKRDKSYHSSGNYDSKSKSNKSDSNSCPKLPPSPTLSPKNQLSKSDRTEKQSRNKRDIITSPRQLSKSDRTNNLKYVEHCKNSGYNDGYYRLERDESNPNILVGVKYAEESQDDSMVYQQQSDNNKNNNPNQTNIPSNGNLLARTNTSHVRDVLRKYSDLVEKQNRAFAQIQESLQA